MLACVVTERFFMEEIFVSLCAVSLARVQWENKDDVCLAVVFTEPGKGPRMELFTDSFIRQHLMNEVVTLATTMTAGGRASELSSEVARHGPGLSDLEQR